jgi:hypothetical protein
MLAAVLCLLATCGAAVDVSGSWAVRARDCDGRLLLAQRGRYVIGHLQLCEWSVPIKGVVSSNEVVLRLRAHGEDESIGLRLSVIGRYASGWLDESEDFEAWLYGQPEPPVTKPRSDLEEAEHGA